jgi:hypothetical protein
MLTMWFPRLKRLDAGHFHLSVVAASRTAARLYRMVSYASCPVMMKPTPATKKVSAAAARSTLAHNALPSAGRDLTRLRRLGDRLSVQSLLHREDGHAGEEDRVRDNPDIDQTDRLE